MEKEIKSIHIDKKVHNKLKTFCEKNDLKMSSWLNKIILKEIENMEKLYDNLQNNK